jgi:hypothetical protein
MSAAHGMIAFMKQNQAQLRKAGQKPVYEFHDVSPSDSYTERVKKGKENETIIKNLLTSYGVTVHDVTAAVDMREKIDLYVSGPFGRLSVQLKVRNQHKNSKRNDVGVEYSRIREGQSVPLYCHEGRDRCSCADIYMCVDAVHGVIHIIPSDYIETASKRLHNQFEVEVTNHKNNYVIQATHRASGEPLTTDGNSLRLRDPCIGEIRYFRPHRSDEGVFKSVFYMRERYESPYEFTL